MNLGIRIRRPLALAAFLFSLLAPSLSHGVVAASSGGWFQTYPEEVRSQAVRVVSAAGPGKEDALKPEVRELSRRMHVRGILSMNAVPEAIFAKAAREGWDDEAAGSLRVVAEAAPLSVPAWAWLLKEDLLSLRVNETIRDAERIVGAARRFGPALMGYVAWVSAFVCAAAGWFAAWASLSLFLRARPSLETDFQRILKVPYTEILSLSLVVLLFLFPLAAGAGLAVAAGFWLLMATPYLRKGETTGLLLVLALLASLCAATGLLRSMEELAGDTRKGGWLAAEGYLPETLPPEGAPIFSADAAWMIDFARGRRDMQSGNPASAERRFTEMLDAGKRLPEVYNSRGVARAQQGKMAAALTDFEEAGSLGPNDGPALWNAYQIYLRTFRLEKAGEVQKQAWENLQKMTPFGFRPAEFGEGEWIASNLPAREAWKVLLARKGDWLERAEASPLFRRFFHPFSSTGALAFLVILAAWVLFWRILSAKLWVNCTCRVCGSRSLIVGSRDESDVCTPCRAHIGGGIRMGDERDRRVQGIVFHRRYVTLGSVLAPGSGGLWAGKDFRTLSYGILLSAGLAVLSTSLGARTGGNPIVSDLQAAVTQASAAIVTVLWGAGSIWGVRSFLMMQNRHNVAMER